MEYNFDTPERKTQEWTRCKLIFKDGTEKTLTKDSSGLERVNVEYNSPLIEGEFPEGGKFSVVYAEIDSESTSIKKMATLNKIFKPYNCNKIELEEDYTTEKGEDKVAKATITFSDDEVYGNFLLTFSTKDDGGASAEVQNHQHNIEYLTKYGFRLKPHETQINGSNFSIQLRDYQEINRGDFLNRDLNFIPYFGSFTLSRGFEKFFLGDYKK